MGKLWNYEDYVDHLTHKNDLVKRWALNALENRYLNRYTDQVHLLLDSENEHLVLDTLRYLTYHKAVQHAPKILELINHSNELISSSTIITLGRLKYEPALDPILSKFHNQINMDDYLSVIQYLGIIRNEESRSVLQSALLELKDKFLLGLTTSSLLMHHHPEDIDVVMEKVFEHFDKLKKDDLLLTHLVYGLGGKSYFQEITENYGNDISKEPDKSLEKLLYHNTHIQFDPELQEKIINAIDNNQYQDLSTMIMFASKEIINTRYPDDPIPGVLRDLKEQDHMSLALLEEISKRSIIWENISLDSKSNLWGNIITTIISLYCGTLERGNYVEALYQDCTDREQLVESLKKAGPSFPQPIKDAITETASPSDIKGVLTDNFDTWGDIWAVRLMKRMGNKEFVPDLLNVLSKTDSLEYIYSDAIFSLAALEESADAELLDALKSKNTDDWVKFNILDHLPYSEAYDVAVQLWDNDSDEMDSYEIFATTLENIGDRRGIKKLQDIFDTENKSLDIWDSIECLAEIHGVDLPEMPDIIRMREEREERHKAGMMELKRIAENYEKRQEHLKQDVFEEGAFKKEEKMETYKRSTPKVGRNDPCPCGSGKKYKKCCLK